MSAWICGLDEAGRGPLAGAVVAAAVILDPARPIVGLNDSKKLTARQRERLAVEIREKALAWAVAEASVEEIDRINILHASLLAMRRAADQLPLPIAEALIDGHIAPKWPWPTRAIVGGVQELVLANVERAEGARLTDVAETALALVAAVVSPSRA